MKEQIAKIIEMLELVEVRRTQNHKLIAGAVDALRSICQELQTREAEEVKNDE